MRYFIILLILLPKQLLAAPAITGITGTVSNGQTITISGSGFGSTGPNVVFFDSFEKGTSGNHVYLTTNSADIAEWDGSEISGGADSTYSSSYAHSGTKSLFTDYATYWGSGPYIRYANVQNTGLFVSFWTMVPTGKDVPGVGNVDGVNWKLFWVGDFNDAFPWGSDMAIECVGTADCSSSEGIAALDDGGAPARYAGITYTPYFTKGVWRRVTVAMKNATSGAYVWQQEVSSGGYQIVDNQTSVVTAHSDDPWNMFAVPGFGRQGDNSAVYTDDVYVATGDGARARVEIGNNATYTSCTNLAIITPTSWSDNSITATVRSGSFTSGTAYLFVVDASGVPSTGTAITINEGSSTIICYQDADNDLYGHGVSESVETCSSGYYIASHFTSLTGDCNDLNANINPGVSEVCNNSIDDNCNDQVDEGCSTGGSSFSKVGHGKLTNGNGRINK